MNEFSQAASHSLEPVNVAVDRRPVTPPYFPAKSREFTPMDGFLSLKWSPNPIVYAVFIGIALILSARNLYIALDDAAYIDYFSHNTYWFDAPASEDWDWWRLIIEEPLWNMYTTAMGAELGPEAALRVTIFISVFLYLFFASKLAGGAWGTTIFLFALHPHLGVQMYFNQIRQGVALSIFLMLVSILRVRTPVRIGAAAAAAALLHSSFIMTTVLTVLYVVKPSVRILASVLGAFALIAVARNIDIFSLIETGRREGLYATTAAVNVNFYIVTLPCYGVIFYLLWPARAKIDVSEWYFLSFVIAIAAIVAAETYEAGGRLVYLAEAAISILVARNIRSQNGLAAFGVWVLSIAIQIISDYKYDIYAQVRVFDKWELIIFGTN